MPAILIAGIISRLPSHKNNMYHNHQLDRPALPMQEPTIKTAVDNLGCSSEELHSVVNNLVDRLSPILDPSKSSPIEVSDGNSKEPSTRSALYEELSSINRTYCNAITRLRELMINIQL